MDRISFYEIKVIVQLFIIPAFLLGLLIWATVKSYFELKEKEKRIGRRDNNRRRRRD